MAEGKNHDAQIAANVLPFASEPYPRGRTACGYQGFGSGDHPAGPGCVLPKGHEGPCSTQECPAANEQDSAFEQLADATDRMRARAALPRTIYVKVSTPLLGELSEWSEPLRVKVERDWNDDTFEMIFKREEAS